MKIINVLFLCFYGNSFVRCIADGKDSPSKSWMVYLHHQNLTCGGILFTERLIITAAQCNKYNKEDWFAHLNRYNLALLPEEENASVHSIINRTDHPGFDWGYEFDISLWEIEASSNKRTKVVLAEDADVEDYESYVTVLGWGSTRRASPFFDPEYFKGLEKAISLKEANLPLNPTDICYERYTQIYNMETMICTGFKFDSANVCQEDTGGPIYRIKNDNVVLIGIINFNLGCGKSNFFSIHINISHKEVKNFIENYVDNME